MGIAGGSGSGKTTFLRAVLNHFSSSEIALVSQDNYYKPRHEQVIDERGTTNFDLPSSIDREHFASDMNALMNGRFIQKTEYNFNNKNRAPKLITILPAPIILMEGLFVFYYEEIRNKLQYKVYIDVHPETRLERRIRRDAEERGYPEETVRYQWENHVRPAEKLYLESFRQECDLIIDNTHSFDKGLKELISYFEIFLKK